MVGLVGVVALGLGAAPASGQRAARGHAEGLLQVLSPQNHQGVFSGGVRIVLRVRRGAAVRVRVNRRDVTRALRLRRHGKPRARFPIVRGRLPQRLLSRMPRMATISARARGRTDADMLVLRKVRRRRGFLTVSTRRTGPGPAPVAVRLRTRTHRLWLAISLNGRRVERAAVATRVGERRILLTRAEGLRYGRNVLRIAANDNHGRGDVERRVLRVPRSGPLVGARWARRAGARSRVRLDARPSVASRRGRRLAFRWRLVRRPRGSRVVIRNPGAQVARIRPDRPGRYVARLQVRERRRGSRAAAAATAPSMTMSLDAVPYVPPYGIEATFDPVNGMVLNPGTNFAPGSAPGSMALARIDGTTTQVDQEIPIAPAGGTRDLSTLLNQVNPISTPGDLIVVIGNQSPAEPSGSATTAALGQLASVLQGLGLSSDDASDAAQRMGQGAPFAFIGPAGSAAGSGAGNFFDGKLNGYLRFTGLSPGLTGQLLFEQPDYRLFDFNGADKQTTVTGVNPSMGTQPTQAIDIPAPCCPQDTTGGGMSVTVLDAVTLEQVKTASIAGEGFNDAFAPVASVLSQYADDPSKLILFKMIQPTAWENVRYDLATIMRSLTAIGANKDAFTRSLYYGRGPSTRNQYVFFGGAGIEPVEGSAFDAVTATNTGGSPIPVSSPSMGGLLKRDQKGRWVPTAATPFDDLDRDLQTIALMPPSEYDYPTDQVPGTQAQYAAAEQALYQELENASPPIFCNSNSPSCTTRPGLRINYANTELLDNLTQAQTALDCSSPQSGSGGDGYTGQQLAALTTRVCGELDDIQEIDDKFFDQMTANVLPAVASGTELALLTDSDDLLGFVNDELDSELQDRSTFLGISGEAAAILEELVLTAVSVASLAAAPEGGPAIGDLAASLLGVSSDTLGLAGEAVGAAEDSDKVAAVEVTAGTLFSYVSTSFQYAMTRMTELQAIVNSDPVKVAAVLGKVDSGAWDLEQDLPNNDTDTAADLVRFHQQAAAQQYIWPRLISAVAQPCDTGGSASDPTTYQAFTKIMETSPPGNYLAFETHYLRGAHLDSSDAQSLAPFLFGQPFQEGYNLDKAPLGAGLPRSPFYMVQIASTSTSTAPDCSEDTF